MFKKFLDTGIVSQLKKKANVPILKKGNKFVVSNYSPISLTIVLGQQFTSIIVKHIRDHFDKHNLIKGTQYKQVYIATDRDDNYDIFYFAFSKPFDKFSHLRLCIAHGIWGKVLR